MASRSLARELEKIALHCPPCVTVSPCVGDIFVWRATLWGPEDTIIHGRVFTLRLLFPFDFPFKQPVIQFEGHIFHPNVSPQGRFCPRRSYYVGEPVYSVLLCVLGVLASPDPEDCANLEAAEMCLFSPDEFWARFFAALQCPQPLPLPTPPPTIPSGVRDIPLSPLNIPCGSGSRILPQPQPHTPKVSEVSKVCEPTENLVTSQKRVLRELVDGVIDDALPAVPQLPILADRKGKNKDLRQYLKCAQVPFPAHSPRYRS